MAGRRRASKYDTPVTITKRPAREPDGLGGMKPATGAWETVATRMASAEPVSPHEQLRARTQEYATVWRVAMRNDASLAEVAPLMRVTFTKRGRAHVVEVTSAMPFGDELVLDCTEQVPSA